MRKLLDPSINKLIKTSCKNNHRALFLIIGDNSKDHVPLLHQLLCNHSTTRRGEILWCYKKELELSADKKKRRRQIRKKVKLGQQLEGDDNPLELFLNSNRVTYVQYRDSRKVLGRTFSLCILQDFEALSPNLLAQTIETVSGSGLVVILLRKMSSLRQLSAMTMDFYARFRSGGRSVLPGEKQGLVCRFIERFILSLSGCSSCLVLDDELNVLQIAGKTHRSAENSTRKSLRKKLLKSHAKNKKELENLLAEMAETKPLVHLLGLCRTLDQAKALMSFADTSVDRKSAVMSITAARGRGKTFVCGLMIAYTLLKERIVNIFVTSPFPQNLGPLFCSLKDGLEVAGYKEHSDFIMNRSLRNEHSKAVVRVEILGEKARGFVQYVSPEENDIILKSQAQLLIIDEAAAIPLPLTQKLLEASCITVLSSTTSGYEGTGRALTLKLLKSLRNLGNAKKPKNKTNPARNHSKQPKQLREISMEHPIRYAPEDPLEKWLSDLLCLETPLVDPLQKIDVTAPHPSACKLCLIDRDALFSGHPASETFLQRVMSLLVASHYKNSPDDLQLLSDAPEHRLFALVHPGEENSMPKVLCVLQMAFEGKLPSKTVQKGFAERVQSPGDLIPWTLSTQYQEKSFASRLGVRVVRLATHPELQGMGYGTRAMELLVGMLSKGALQGEPQSNGTENSGKEEIGKGEMPPLLTALEEIEFKGVSWIGVSFGLTQKLFDFWEKSGFKVVHIRQSCNKFTGEHSCIMLKDLAREDENRSEIGQIASNSDFFVREFHPRFISLLGSTFNRFTASVALSIIHSISLQNTQKEENKQKIISVFITENDITRLESFTRNLVDYSTIIDLIPRLAELFFRNCFEGMNLSFVQKAILVAVGFQRKKIEELADELDLMASQLMGLFHKMIRKMAKEFAKENRSTDNK